MACPVIAGDGTAWAQTAAVFAAQQAFAGQRMTELSLAMGNFQAAIAELEAAFVKLDVDIDVEDYTPDGDPTEPGEFNGIWNPPDDPPNITITEYTPDALVEVGDPPTKPELDFSGRPDQPDIDVPTEPPAITTPSLPSDPSITLPSPPSLRNIPIPELDPLSLPTFSATAPTISLPGVSVITPDAEDGYSSAVLTALQNQILTVLNGDRGYLDEIWDAIWAREEKNEIEASEAARMQIQELWASNGWAAPGGVEAEQLLKVDQELQHKRITRAREMAIEQNKQEVERFNFHVAQGIALENMLIGLYSQMAERELKRVEITNAAALAFLDAYVKSKNLEMDLYKTKAQVHRDLIQAELAKVEVFKAEIEASALIQGINEQDVKIYLGRLEGVQKEIAIYLAQLDGVKTQNEINRTIIAVFAEKLNAIKTAIEAEKVKFEAWDLQVRGELGRVQLFSAEANLFANEVQAVAQENTARLGIYNGKVEGEKLKLEKLDALTKKFSAQMDGAIGYYESQRKAHEQYISGYKAHWDAESAILAAKAQKYNADVAKAKATSDLALSQGQINAANIMRVSELQLGALEKVATIYASLVSSAMSALDAQSQIQGSQSQRWDYSFECDS